MTSILKVDRIEARQNGGSVTFGSPINPDGFSSNYRAGEIIQQRAYRWDELHIYNAGGEGTAATYLQMALTPLVNDSTLHFRWMIFGEPENHNISWRVFKSNGSAFAVDTTSGYEGYNNNPSVDAGQFRTVAMAQPYETNYSSTPYQSELNHITTVTALGGTLQEYKFSPAVYNNNGTGNFRINSSYTLVTDGSYENGVSFGFATEIAAYPS